MKGVKKLIWIAFFVAMVLALTSCDNFAPGSGSSGGGSNPVAEAKLVGIWKGTLKNPIVSYAPLINVTMSLNEDYAYKLDVQQSGVMIGEWSASDDTLKLNSTNSLYSMNIHYSLSDNDTAFTGSSVHGWFSLTKQS